MMLLLNLLKCIHAIFINVDFHKEDFRGILLRVTPRVSQDGELIECLTKQTRQDIASYLYQVFPGLPADRTLPLWFQSSESGDNGVVSWLSLHIGVEFVRGECDDGPSCAPLQQLAHPAVKLALEIKIKIKRKMRAT